MENYELWQLVLNGDMVLMVAMADSRDLYWELTQVSSEITFADKNTKNPSSGLFLFVGCGNKNVQQNFGLSGK
jgi:hypothetical protein